MFGIDDIATATAAAAAINTIGGILQQDSANRAAEGQMNFQREMSNTSHQREVADLQAAGLNPILSARYGGSSTPSGAMAPQINVLSGGVSGALEAYRAGLEGERNPSLISLQSSSAKHQFESAMLDVEQQEVARRTALRIGVETTNIEAGTARILYELREVLPSIYMLNKASTAERAQMAEKIAYEVDKLLPAELRKLQSTTSIIAEHLKGMMVEGQIDETTYGKILRYLGRLPVLGFFMKDGRDVSSGSLKFK